ncbi:PREDICTED: eukaryotic translation initiation factor 3 subunit D-like [Priapulus caudatus]|uniref:Eukaryotic translation initiation factor 3 subunit p66 n=1 Tax=Priapulus caudatus TaxID=37621 RepID=A0ABM1EGX8_PRICU|nr:PREDICTED: eukaryotic translation initiation factor 3 subunit D-like [Priapulus caudatus]
MSAKFIPPKIQDNPSGWGPCAVPDQFKDMPYQPFYKADRLGKASDWTGSTYTDKRYTNRYQSQFSSANQYAYYHEEDESSFQLVDTSKVQRPMYQRGRGRFQRRDFRRERERRDQKAANSLQVLSKTQKSRERDRQRQMKKWQKQYGVRQKFDNRGQNQQKSRDASVQIRAEWKVVEEMDFPRLSKLNLPNLEAPKDVMCCGSLEYYDKPIDRVNTRTERKLQRVNRIFHKVTTTDDPVIRQLAKTEGNVFATDAIVATLMTCARSVYSWDIVVQRVGNKLFFDKREDSEFVPHLKDPNKPVIRIYDIPDNTFDSDEDDDDDDDDDDNDADEDE